MQKRLLIFLVLISTVEQTLACNCSYQELEFEVKRTKTIVHGRVLSLEVTSLESILTITEKEYLQNRYKDEPFVIKSTQNKLVVKVELEIIEVLKGETDKKIISIYTSKHGPECGYIGFIEDKEFVVFLSPKKLPRRLFAGFNDNIDDSRLWTNRCTRTKVFDQSEANNIKQLLKK